MADFPLDDVTLAMLEASCQPDSETGRTHLFEMLGGPGVGRLLDVTDDGIEVREGGWSVAETVLALVQEVGRMREFMRLRTLDGERTELDVYEEHVNDETT